MRSAIFELALASIDRIDLALLKKLYRFHYFSLITDLLDLRVAQNLPRFPQGWLE
jgi:hypothetical protein